MPVTDITSAIGFKEWALICDALTQGVQTIILRKGGIHEGRGGFEWKHREFFLFPTWFHTQAEKMTWAPGDAQTTFPPEDERTSVDVSGFARLERVWKVTDWDRVAALAPHHKWREEIVRERFVYDEESCLHVALVRAWRLPSLWTFPYQKSYGGCRSWITLPEEGLRLLDAALPAMSDEVWSAEVAAVKTILDAP